MKRTSILFTLLASLYFCGHAYGLKASSSSLEVSKDSTQIVIIKISLPNEKQTIENFGASDYWTTKFIGKWANELKKNLIAHYLFSTDTLANGQPKGIGLSFWRFNIGSGSFEQGKASAIGEEYRREECFLDANGNYDPEKQKGQQWFLNVAKRRGLNNFLASSITPPIQFIINGKACGLVGSNLNLKKGKEEDYANFMTIVVKHLDKMGYHMPDLGLFKKLR